MLKKLLIKWNNADSKEDGKYWLAASLLSEEYNKDGTQLITNDEIIDLAIKALFWKHLFSQLKWWIFYGFKCNRMYWYKNR